MHAFVGKYYADIMTLFALLLPFLLIFYNQKATKKSQLDENSERWMERLRQASTDFTKNVIELYWLTNDSKELNDELARWPGEISLISIRSARSQKNMEVKSAAISSQTKLTLYFSEDSLTLDKIAPIMDQCLEMALDSKSDATEFSNAIDEFLAIIDDRIANEWKSISIDRTNWFIPGLAIIATLFLVISVIQFAQIGKQIDESSIERSILQIKVDSMTNELSLLKQAQRNDSIAKINSMRDSSTRIHITPIKSNQTKNNGTKFRHTRAANDKQYSTR